MKAARERRSTIHSKDFILRGDELGKSFGPFQAVKDVSIGIRDGSIHAIIGPNGSGKSTLLKLIAGELKLNNGVLRFHDEVITRVPLHSRSRLGIGKTSQAGRIFEELSVVNNIRIAALRGYVGYLPQFARKARDIDAVVDGILSELPLNREGGRLANELSHGERKLLELGMVLATKPQLLLLDEPTAGLTREESAELATFIYELGHDMTVVLVEHDMDLVKNVASFITVLDYGTVLAEGTVREIEASAAVQNAYLTTT